ncbi:MAG: hypothetical protein M3Z84_02360 [Actinomycetota bacterium]|nr:hypothetical protein [Actinomycetota bacterium]
MSTFLVSLGVMVVAVAFVTWFAVRDMDQRATTRSATVREHPAVTPPASSSTTAARAPAPRVPPREVPVYLPGGRARAGLALSVLVTFIGVMVALVIAGGIVLVAQGLRNSLR